MLKSDVQIEGHANIQLRLRDDGRRRSRAVLEGMVAAAEWLLRKSQEIVPVDKGVLFDSGHVEIIKDGRRKEVVVMYDAPYAVFVHEDLTKKHAQGKEAKFLEKPYRQGIQVMGRIVANRIRQA